MTPEDTNRILSLRMQALDPCFTWSIPGLEWVLRVSHNRPAIA